MATDKRSIDDRARFDLIRYANCWEDAHLLRVALQPGPNKRILSIASAGDNCLDLLASGAEVTAVDLSLPQLAALALRVAAFRRLEYEPLLAFLGLRPSQHRRQTFARIKADLPQPSRRFWEAHPDQIDAGPIHAGKFERYFATFRTRVLPLIHNRKRIDALLTPKTQDERRRFYTKTWNSRRWQLLFRLFFSRRVMGALGRDPEFFRYVNGPVSAEILRRAERALNDLPTHYNPYLTFILRGNFDNALPPYLEEKRFEAIRQNLDRLTTFHGTVQDAAQAAPGFDGFNLSDIFEYLDEDTSTQVFDALLNAARPQARFAYWNMMVPRRLSRQFPDRLDYLEKLSTELHAKDRAFFYGDFIVEQAR